MKFWTPGGTKRIEQATPTQPRTMRPPPPVRPRLASLTTQQEVLSDARQIEQQTGLRSEPPPASGAVLELIATDLRRVSKRLDRLEKKDTRSFDLLKFLGSLGASLPFIALVWGEWIKRNPSVGGTAVAGWVTALLAAFQVKKMYGQKEGEKREGE